MAEYNVWYRDFYDTMEQNIQANIGVSLETVQLSMKVPLIPFRVHRFVSIVCSLLLLLLLPIIRMISLYWDINLSSHGIQILVSYTVILICIVLADTLKFRKLVLEIPRADITGYEQNAREVLLQTAQQQFAFTTITVADAQMLYCAFRDGTATPSIIAVRQGREHLYDCSGFYHQKLIEVSIVDGTMIVKGSVKPGRKETGIGLCIFFGSFLIPMFLLIFFPIIEKLVNPIFMLIFVANGWIVGMWFLTYGKVVERAFPLSSLKEISVVQRFVTFLVPADKAGELRYTIYTSSSEDAEILAKCMVNDEGLPCKFSYKEKASSRDGTAIFDPILQRSTSGNFTQAGMLAIEGDQVIFTGHSGISHPRTGIYSLLISFIVYLILVLFLVHYQFRYPFDDIDRTKVILFLPALAVGIFVFLPVSSIMAHLLSKRAIIKRSDISVISTFGREATLVIASKSNTLAYTRYTVVVSMGSNAEAKELAAILPLQASVSPLSPQ